MPKKTYDQLVTENKKIKDLMTHTAEEYNKGCDDRYKLQQENEKLKEQKRNLVEASRKVRKRESESHQNQKKGDYIMKLEEENKELKAKIDDLEGRLEDVDHIAGEWEDQVDELKEEMSNRSDDLCEIAKALGIEWHGEIKDIMTTITSLKKSNEYKTKIIRKARKQAQDLLKGDNE
jgi:predicted  nucleic acid-binding Zn-ribbon protein